MTVPGGLLVTALVSLLLSVAAAGGAPDPTFGAEGKVTTTFADRSSSVWALALQRDGKIVAVGTAGSEDEEVGGLALARYHMDGSPDTSFGLDGKVLADAGAGQTVAVQADGKLVVGGDDRLVRFLPDGRLDRSFGTDGTVRTGFRMVRVVLARKGIVAVGIRASGLVQNGVLVLARYRPDGTLDPGFGTQGVIRRPGYRPVAAAPGPGGKIVVSSPRIVNPECGSADGCVDPDIDIRLLRYLPDGRLDRTFGNRGIVVRRARPHSTGLSALAVQPSGKILVGGHGHADDACCFMVVRFNADGSIDRGFGRAGTGVAVASVGFGIRALAADPWGGIVAAGASMNLADFVVARFCTRGCGRFPAGELDSLFGSVTTDFGAYETPWAVAVQADGAVVAAGQTGRGLFVDTDFALVRYR